MFTKLAARTMAVATVLAICASGMALGQEGESSRFSFDRSSYLSQYDLFFERPTSNWALGVPIGNGDVGVLQWGTPDEVYFGINKADVWDRRYDSDAQELIVDVKTLTMLLERAPKALQELNNASSAATQLRRYPTPKRCGALIIRTPGAKDYTSFQDRLRLHSAAIDSKYQTAVDSRTIHTFVHKDENLLVVRMKFDGKPVSREIELMRPPDQASNSNIENAVAFVEGKDFGIEQHFPAHERFPEDFHYVLRGRIIGSEYQPKAEGYQAKARLPESARGEVTVLVAVVSSRDNPNPKKAAKDILDRAVAKGTDAVESEHRKQWDKFWNACMIDLPDEVDLLEHAWYVQTYVAGCTSKPGKYLPGICGLWAWSDFASWNGDYHTDQNIQMQHWGLFSSNHPELALPFCEMFYKMLPLAQEDAKRFFDCRGARYAVATSEYNGNLAGLPYFMELSNSPWIAHVFWWYYDYTRDLKFLKERAYPVMREVTRFFADYMKKDEKGTYYIYPSVPMEQGRYSKNPLTDTSSVIRLLETTIEASSILNIDAKERNRWQEILKNMSPLPQADGLFCMAEEVSPHSTVNHALLTNPVFPAEIVGLDRGGPLFRTAMRTLENQFTAIHGEKRANLAGLFGHTRSWSFVSAARLGMAERAVNLAYQSIWCFVMENGLPTTFDSYGGCYPLMDVMGAYPLGINEMLMQSYSGRIRLFPATPQSWKDVRFHRLRASGAHLVTAEKRSGEVAYALIESLKGAPCTLVNPWSGEKVTVRDTGAGKTLLESTDKELSFETRPGGRYLIERAGRPASSFTLTALKSTATPAPKSLGERKNPEPRPQYEGKWLGRRARCGGRPIAGTEKGNIINLDAMVDCRVHTSSGYNYDRPTAACTDIFTTNDEQQNAAWFGLEFDRPTEIRRIEAYPAELYFIYYSFPVSMNIAEDYVVQYWDGSDWKDIPGTRVTGSKDFEVIHEFQPVKTTKVRMLITKVAESQDGNGKPNGKFRACMQEFHVE
ncbi:MAG: glycoside hydrolase N-terminal domain-containing protein [Armatimonadetes bacterium]|nr:glycoside hydrolase N-terminal domain-containing protein [Armatimonadota bacterium]